MNNFILQISIWLISYFFIGKNTYTDKCDNKLKKSIFRSLTFLILSFILNGTTNFIVLNLIPAISLLVINYYEEDFVKKDLKKYLIVLLIQVVIVSEPFILDYIFKNEYSKLIIDFKSNRHLIYIIFSYIMCLTPANIFIKIIIDYYIKNKSDLEKFDIKGDNDSLEKAGRLIGNIERSITLGLLFSNQYEAIGFLLAAKSIIRTKDSKADSEYILVGTLLSFGYVILVGILVKYWMEI